MSQDKSSNKLDSYYPIGHQIEVEVEAIAHGGHCVARHEGRVLFVRHAIPGERVIAEITEDRGGSYCRADAVHVVRASDQRVEAPCPYAKPGHCGGCDFQHVAPAHQRELKAAVLQEQLERLGHLSSERIAELGIVVHPLSSEMTGWRTRMRFNADSDGHLGLRRYRSHDLVAIDRCLIADEHINNSSALTQRWPAGTQVQINIGDAGVTSVLAEQRSRSGNKGRNAVVAGPRYLNQSAAGRLWRVRAGGFWQVHPLAAQTLATTVLDLAEVRKGETILDLYAGAGLFAGALAKAVGSSGEVIAVEANKAAVNDARRNLQDLPWVDIQQATVEKALRDFAKQSVDVVVLDPPRAGAGKQVVTAIAGFAPRVVVYVACDPAAFGRDVALLAEAGYELCELRAFDAFPMTHHLECVGLFKPLALAKT